MNTHANNCDSLEGAVNTIHNSAVNRAHAQYGNDDYDDSRKAASEWLKTGMKTRLGKNHADDTADKFIGGELWVKPGTSPVTTYSNKSMSATTAIKTYKPGTFIGVVYSYVNEPPMFMTEDNQFVPLETSTFDKEKMDASLVKAKAAKQAAISKVVDARKEETYKTNSLYALGADTKAGVQKVTDAVGSAISFGGDFIKWGLIIGGLVLAYTFYVRYSNA